ncbi:hypothetical protein ACTWM0_01515 [Pseudomonas machongensis]
MNTDKDSGRAKPQPSQEVAERVLLSVRVGDFLNRARVAIRIFSEDDSADVEIFVRTDNGLTYTARTTQEKFQEHVSLYDFVYKDDVFHTVTKRVQDSGVSVSRHTVPLPNEAPSSQQLDQITTRTRGYRLYHSDEAQSILYRVVSDKGQNVTHFLVKTDTGEYFHAEADKYVYQHARRGDFFFSSRDVLHVFHGDFQSISNRFEPSLTPVSFAPVPSDSVALNPEQ